MIEQLVRQRFAARRISMVMILVFASAVTGPQRAANAGDNDDEGKAESVQATEHKHTNRLINSTSPYLLQHAHNPVDWYEWGAEALNRAKKENKPIFLSIGYSACHWCHVMEHESFEDESIATILNAEYVCIKVDREERPDIDEIYMQATVGLTQHGGWPMSVFTTPDGTPFYCGTYFPPDRFQQLILQIAKMWREEREGLVQQGRSVKNYLDQWAAQVRGGEDLIPEQIVVETARLLVNYFDMQLGGPRSDGNKFPPSMAMDMMLRAYKRTGETKLLNAVNVTLTRMARGGIYDHLGGGICRYSTDPQWLVPHFEKMLYDQALVSGIYIDGFQVERNPLFEQAARGILDYVIADLQSPEGGFYSTRDADSEGMEGKFYIWTVEQVREVLGEKDAELFCNYFDVTESGNWFESRGHAPEGPKNILNIQKDDESFCRLHKLEPADWKKRLAGMKARMLEARATRVAPGLDDKILTGWNGLMIASMAKAGQVFDEPRYADSARRAAEFVLSKMRKEGRLVRTYRKGEARLTAYLSDYAFMVEGLLNLYETDFDVRWLDEAVNLTDDMIAHYADDEHGAFFFTADDAEQLIMRSKDPSDGAIPSGNSVALMNLSRLAVFTGKREYKKRAESIMRTFAPMVDRMPNQFERMICAVDFYFGAPKEIAILGRPADPNVRAMLGAVRRPYLPNKVVTAAPDASAAEALADRIPLLKGKKLIDGGPTAYVCQNYQCKKPVSSAADLSAQLAGSAVAPSGAN